MRIRIFVGLVALLAAPSLAWAQVVIPGTGGAVVTPPGQRTSVIPGLCSGTDKVAGITVTGAVQCLVLIRQRRLGLSGVPVPQAEPFVALIVCGPSIPFVEIIQSFLASK